jgi:hypothetical protein
MLISGSEFPPENPPLLPPIPLLPPFLGLSGYGQPFSPHSHPLRVAQATISGPSTSTTSSVTSIKLAQHSMQPESSSTAVISAEPEMRDFRKESTAFVPTTLKRKKTGVSKVDSRPDVGTELSVLKREVDNGRPDLVSTLQNRLSQFGKKS